MPNPSKEFTAFEWHGWSGSERWAEGVNPLIRYMTNVTIIADKSGIAVIDEDGENEATINMPITQAAARLFIDALPDLPAFEDYATLGFK